MTAAIVLLALAVPPPPARAQGANMTVHACRRIDIREIVQGSQVIYTQCGSQFSAADPYIAAVAHLSGIRSRTTIVVELLDPDQAVVWTRSGTIAPPEGQDIYYSDLWLWGLLPLSADTGRLVAENPRLILGVIRLSGKPARERVGSGRCAPC